MICYLFICLSICLITNTANYNILKYIDNVYLLSYLLTLPVIILQNILILICLSIFLVVFTSNYKIRKSSQLVPHSSRSPSQLVLQSTGPPFNWSSIQVDPPVNWSPFKWSIIGSDMPSLLGLVRILPLHVCILLIFGQKVFWN